MWTMFGWLRAEAARASRSSLCSSSGSAPDAQDLDGHRAAQARVAGPVHLAHGARAQAVHHLVGADARAGREGVCHVAARGGAYHAAPEARDGARPTTARARWSWPGTSRGRGRARTRGTRACGTSRGRPGRPRPSAVSLRVRTARTGIVSLPTTITPRGSSRNVRHQLRGFRLHDRTKTRPRTTTAQIPMTRCGAVPARMPRILPSWMRATSSSSNRRRGTAGSY